MSLDRILDAESVAVIGASRDVTKRGFQALRILLDEKYEGRIYPVNPKEKSLLGLTCYKSVEEIPDPVDVALITTPARTIAGLLADCGRKGVAGAVIIAGGFGEMGDEGKKLEAEIVKAAHENHVRLIGPNTSGMINLKSRMNLVGLKDAPPGNIALISQSGNMALSLITEAKLKSSQGFSYYVGVGNEADIRFHEYLEFFSQDPHTRAILLYVEGMRRGREFLQEAYRATLEKPIILLKGGRSSIGQHSAGSHTGALAGMSEVSRSAFQRAGIVVIENPDELFPVAETLASLPPVKGNRVAILADGGGHATIAADLLTDMGVEIPELSEKTREKLKKILPPASSVRNPVDVAGGTDNDPAVFADCVDAILKDPNVGGLLLVGLFGGYGIRFAEVLSFKEEDAAHRMGKMVRDGNKPIVVHSLYASEKPHPLQLLRYYKIPVYDSLEVACKCMGTLSEYGSYLKEYHAKTNFVFQWGAKRTEEGAEIIKAARAERRTALLENEARALFALHGTPVATNVLARTPEEAEEAAAAMKGPVALKIVSPDILHKTDAGGVRLNLKAGPRLRRAFNEIMESAVAYKPEADIRGVLVTPMASPGVEVIIGTKIDDQFGPVIMFGLGGVFVEILKDVSFRVLPISSNSARKMMEEIRSYPLLAGYRGRQSCDLKNLRKLLTTVSELVESYPEIHEMDLNPVIATENGVQIVDARIILKEPAKNE